MSAEPRMYFYKQFIVVLVLTAVGIVLAAPFVQAGGILWYLAFFTSINLFNAVGQTMRMISVVRKMRARLVPRAPGPHGHALKSLPKAAGPRDVDAQRDGGGAYLLRVDDVPAWHHVFVIPNYKEDLEVLCATLDRLASHRHAPHYTILLAMVSG